MYILVGKQMANKISTSKLCSIRWLSAAKKTKVEKKDRVFGEGIGFCVHCWIVSRDGLTEQVTFE